MPSGRAWSSEKAWLMVVMVTVTFVSTHASRIPTHAGVPLSQDTLSDSQGQMIDKSETRLVGRDSLLLESPKSEDKRKVADPQSCPSRCRCGRETVPDSTPEAPYTVNCTGLGLTRLPTSVWVATEALIVAHNKLPDLEGLTELRMPRLRHLDLGGNWLRRLGNNWLFEHVPALEYLSLSDNGLKTVLHGSFNGLVELRTLDLSKNQIITIETHAFTGLARLETLRLENNFMYEVKRDWLMGLPSLVTLTLSHNRLTDIEGNTFNRLTRLQRLDLSYNALRDVKRDSLIGLVNLNILDVTGNTQFRQLPVDMGLNKQATLNDKEAPKDNTVHSVTHHTSPDVSLRQNSTLNSGLDTVRVILLDGALFPRISTNGVSRLSVVELSLSFLPLLRVVDRHAFSDLPLLHTLQLHDNPKLVYLHPHAFSGLPKLSRLLVHNNALRALPSTLPTLLPSLHQLEIHHNPLVCDCGARWLQQEINGYGYGIWLNKHIVLYSHDNSTSSNSSEDSSSTVDTTVKPNTSSYADSSQPVMQQNGTVLTHTVKKRKPVILNSATDSNTKPSTQRKSFIKKASSVDALSLISGPPVITEPGRVACFPPGGGAPLPLHQLAPLHAHCPPTAIPIFPPTVSLNRGDDLWLECHGNGEPTPTITWILPNGIQINESDVASGNPQTVSPGVVGGTTLHVPAESLSGGLYICRADSSHGSDISSASVTVYEHPLIISHVDLGGDFFVVSVLGAIPRDKIHQFQLVCRTTYYVNPANQTNEQQRNDPVAEKSKTSNENNKVDYAQSSKAVLEINLRYPVHKYKMTNLRPSTTYTVCLMYNHRQTFQCGSYTTLGHVSLATPPSGITRISKTRLIVGVACVLTTVLFILGVAMFRRSRYRKDYLAPLGDEEKAAIPLAGLAPHVPGTPLTSSRTALLTREHT